MLHYDPQHVSNSMLLILRRTNFMTRQMFSLLHLTSSLWFTSLITAILLHYCFISTLF